jgi:hypothetical protein
VGGRLVTVIYLPLRCVSMRRKTVAKGQTWSCSAKCLWDFQEARRPGGYSEASLASKFVFNSRDSRQARYSILIPKQPPLYRY